jgi:hypothetical protein
MILRIMKGDRSKAKESANRGAVASSPLFRSPAREWSDAVKKTEKDNKQFLCKKKFASVHILIHTYLSS